MNKYYLVTLCAMVLFSFANCGKKDDPKGSADMNAMCAQLQSSQQAYANGACNYNYAAASGGVFTNYGTTNSMYTMTGYGGGQGCQSGTTPVYSASKGLGCVMTQQISYSGQPASYSYNQMTNSFVTVSAVNAANLYAGNMYNPYGTSTGYTNGYTNGNLYGTSMGANTVLRACEDNDKCPESQACRAPVLNSPSRIGICYHN